MAFRTSGRTEGYSVGTAACQSLPRVVGPDNAE